MHWNDPSFIGTFCLSTLRLSFIVNFRFSWKLFDVGCSVLSWTVTSYILLQYPSVYRKVPLFTETSHLLLQCPALYYNFPSFIATLHSTIFTSRLLLQRPTLYCNVAHFFCKFSPFLRSICCVHCVAPFNRTSLISYNVSPL